MNFDQPKEEPKQETTNPSVPAKNIQERSPKPEEIRETRRKEIIAEIEKGWEMGHGPIERSMTEREIEETKFHEDFMGRKWNGRTKVLTDKGRDFYFGFSGEPSVPKQADALLYARYPEYREADERARLEAQIEAQKKTESNSPVLTEAAPRRDIPVAFERDNVEKIPIVSKEREEVAPGHVSNLLNVDSSVLDKNQPLDQSLETKPPAKAEETFNSSLGERVGLKEEKRRQDEESLARVREELGLTIPSPSEETSSSPANEEEQENSVESLDKERELKKALGDIVEPFTKFSNLLKRRDNSHLDEIFDKGSNVFLARFAQKLQEFSTKKELTSKDGGELTDAFSGIIKMFDRTSLAQRGGSKTMNENRESLQALSILAREINAPLHSLEEYSSRNTLQGFENLSSLVKGLGTRVGNVDIYIQRRMGIV